MKLHSLKREQILPGSPQEVFPFFERPENLSRITPPWLRFLIRTPSPVAMKEGAVIDYTIRWMGIPLRWRTLVTAYRPPWEFVDEQIRGPYTLWRHTHRFEVAQGGTRMLDEVLYAVPGGVAGRILQKVLIRHQVEAIFDYRARVIAGLLAKSREEGL